MEDNGLFHGMGNSGILSLEMPIHTPHNPQNPRFTHKPQTVPFAMSSHESNPDPHNPQSLNPNYPFAPKPKTQLVIMSDEDEPHCDEIDGGSSGKSKASLWHRMKWTDNMVRLLIMAVFYIGDDQCVSDTATDTAVCSGGGKKKGGSGGGGVLQKKGKWKSVSRAMIEKGFCVSPQQCEDKFNDLNKRYKRVNDILGKGIACKVVENQALLENMGHLSSKMKEEVRKLLNSKHLFFREMCAYHNSCGGGGAVVGPPAHHQVPSSDDFVCNLGKTRKRGSSVSEEHDAEDEDEDQDRDEDDEDEDEDHEQNVTDHKERSLRKRQRKSPSPLQSSMIEQLNKEIMFMLHEESRNPYEKKQWLDARLMKLEEEKLGYQCEAFELEKQRLKWAKFSCKKEREMERAKLKNERTQLENERMMLLLRQKEHEITQFYHRQQCSAKRGDPSSVTG